jgi:hypothetical protein
MGQAFRSSAKDFSGRGCGTAACIYGWFGEAFTDDYERMSLAEFLGVDDTGVVGPLIMPDGYAAHPERFPATAAVACLRDLAATGVVDWQRALEATA